MIFRLGRSAVAKAGATGWPAYQQAALEARQDGSEKGGCNKRSRQEP